MEDEINVSITNIKFHASNLVQFEKECSNSMRHEQLKRKERQLRVLVASMKFKKINRVKQEFLQPKMKSKLMVRLLRLEKHRSESKLNNGLHLDPGTIKKGNPLKLRVRLLRMENSKIKSEVEVKRELIFKAQPQLRVRLLRTNMKSDLDVKKELIAKARPQLRVRLLNTKVKSEVEVKNELISKAQPQLRVRLLRTKIKSDLEVKKELIAKARPQLRVRLLNTKVKSDLEVKRELIAKSQPQLRVRLLNTKVKSELEVKKELISKAQPQLRVRLLRINGTKFELKNGKNDQKRISNIKPETKPSLEIIKFKNQRTKLRVSLLRLNNIDQTKRNPEKLKTKVIKPLLRAMSKKKLNIEPKNFENESSKPKAIVLNEHIIYEQNIFEQGSKPEQIVKIFPSLGQIWYLLKFKNRRRLEFLESKVVNQKWPKMVIKYLESCIKWI
ncbi:HP1A.2 family protein [Megaselia abdita]